MLQCVLQRVLKYVEGCWSVLEVADAKYTCTSEHYVLGAARLEHIAGGRSYDSIRRSMYAKASVLLLLSCRPHDAARAASAALLLRHSHTTSRRGGALAASGNASHGATTLDRVNAQASEHAQQAAYQEFLTFAEGEGGGDLGGYGEGGEEEEEDDAIVDSALRQLQRLQGPTCAATVRDTCGQDPKQRHRLARALATCLS